MLTIILIIGGAIAIYDGEEKVIGYIETILVSLLLDGMTVLLAHLIFKIPN